MRGKRCCRLAPASLCLAAAVIAGSCGGGRKEDEYPDVKGTYGGLTFDTGLSNLRWVAADGSVTERLCSVMISVTEQSEASFAGDLQRVSYGSGPVGICAGEGRIVGEIAKDRSTRFGLTQERWSNCTARGPVLYTGTIVSGEIAVSGSAALQCDDGSTATVQDSIRAALPHIPGL